MCITNNDWDIILQDEFKKDYYIELTNKLDVEYNTYQIFPPRDKIFNAYKFTPYKDIKIVILGQDPYYNPNQANGLAFSVSKEVKIPPSLVNIYKEIESEYKQVPNNDGDLEYLAKNGVFLLNTVLTVRSGMPNSHINIGWEKFTDNTIKLINDKETPVVFMLWGNNAIKKEKLITNKNHLILKTTHPSPLSSYRGFLGCNHFKLANEFLINNNISPVNWIKDY